MFWYAKFYNLNMEPERIPLLKVNEHFLVQYRVSQDIWYYNYVIKNGIGALEGLGMWHTEHSSSIIYFIWLILCPGLSVD